MFQKSLQILFAAALLALASIVGYALLRLRGAPETLAEAEAHLAAKQYAQAIRVLNLCEGSRSMHKDPAMRQRLWHLRLQANSELGNARGALNDVENLLRDGLEADEELQLEQIRLLAIADHGTRALQLARAFLDRHPNHGRALELAGEACQAATADQLERISAAIQRAVGPTTEAQAETALMMYLHRPDGDWQVAQAIATLASIYAAEARLAADWPPMLRDLRDLRQRVQEGLQFFRSSMESDGQPVAAQRALASSLNLSQRTDDLLMLCEMYRHRFDNEAVAEAGSTAAWAMVRRGANAAAIATAERWLPSQALQRRIDAGTLGDAAPDLMLARVVAAWRLDDRATMGRLYGDLAVLLRAEVPALIPRHVLIGLLHHQKQEWKHAEANLRFVTETLMREPPAPGQIDLLPELVPLRLEQLRLLAAPEATSLALMSSWQKARPMDLEPKLTFARHLMERNQLSAAQAVLAEAATNDPDNDKLFLLRFAAARSSDEQAGQGGDALLAQCLRRSVQAPEVGSPFGYLFCGEAALRQRHYGIARECARMAVEAFPRQRVPRLLEINACLQSDKAQEASALAQRLVDMLPVDTLTAWTALLAQRAAKLPIDAQLFQAMPRCPPFAELREAILRAALQHGPTEAFVFATPVLQDPEAPTSLRLLAARAMAVAGHAAACRRLLDGLPRDTKFAMAERDDLALATAAWVEAAAAESTDEQLAAATERIICRLDVQGTVGPDAMLRSAKAIETTHPGTAYGLCAYALATADPESRSGAAYSLAGRLAARLRQPQKAEEHWLAALAFPDGRGAAKDLVRFCIGQGRLERALLVHKMVEDHDDAALTAWSGDKERAATLATAALGKDGLDLLAHATLAALGKPSLVEWQDVPAPQAEARLELLALLSGSNCGAAALSRAQAMADEQPMSTTARLLLARAHVLASAPAEAARIHTDLLARGAGPLLWRELALAAKTPGYVLTKQAETALVEAVTLGVCNGSPATAAFGLQRVIDNFAAAGHLAAAQQARETLWLQFPRESVRSPADLAHVAAFQDPRAAWTVLDAILADQQGKTRGQVREQLYTRAEQIAALPSVDLTAFYAAAQGHLTSEGPFGCIVHFLLDHGDRAPQLRPDATASRQMLLAQLELAATGRDPGPWSGRSVDRLLQEHDPAATLADVTGVLQRCPTSLPLWRARATVMARQQAAAAGVADLRGVLAHADAPAETLALIILAAAAGLPGPTDAGLLDSLPKQLQASADGQLARGLLALGSGKPDAAIPLLAKASPQPDGLHLFALALACLQSRDSKGAEQARGHLEALARDYPSSSLARNAGSFANQLRPR